MTELSAMFEEDKAPATDGVTQTPPAPSSSVRQKLDDWEASLPGLMTRFPTVKVGTLYCVYKVQLNPDVEFRDIQAEAHIRAIPLSGRSLHQAKVLRRLDNMSRSMFALVEPCSCFAGSLLEIAWAADRAYMLDDPDGANRIQLHLVNRGAFPAWHGMTRRDLRLLGEPASLQAASQKQGPVTAADAEKLGLVTRAPDDIDWDDEVRLAIEERVAFSPDALTGMEQNLRLTGPESMETKIFGRLTAWQNWIFQRPNAVGERGALSLYGKPMRPEFDWRRT